MALFAQQCSEYQRRDCDPIADGAWKCSSEVIGSGAPAGGSQPKIKPNTQPKSNPTTGLPSTEVCTAQGNSLAIAKRVYQENCPNLARVDCDPIGGGRWECSSRQIGDGAPNQPDPPKPTNPEPTNPEPAEPIEDTDVKMDTGDILSLHYDNCPDRDDGHAMAAGYTVTQELGINPLVVNGTCGNSIRHEFQPSSANVVDTTFVNALNAETSRVQSVTQAAITWASVLANGDDVWVAEGGPSDFTAEVLIELNSQFPELNSKRIHVVQHSDWNEENTSAANLQYVKSVASYIRIEDGNKNNQTANFNQKSGYFISKARSSRYANAWNAAFNYLNPIKRLDFSDTVELLFIINDTSTKTPNDFANRYLN